MARFTFRLPDIGEGIAEAEIVAWHVKVGDRVEEDQQVADMMTDKATVEMESPVSGVVLELAGEVGDQVPIGSALMVVETDGDEADAPQEPPEEALEAETPGVEEASVAEPFACARTRCPACPRPCPQPAPDSRRAERRGAAIARPRLPRGPPARHATSASTSPP